MDRLDAANKEMDRVGAHLGYLPSEMAKVPRATDKAVGTSVKIDRGEWQPMDAKALLRRIAVANTANHTGHINYNAGGKVAHARLRAVIEAMCDNILLKVIAPEYHTKLEEGKDDRSRVYQLVQTVRDKIVDTIKEFQGPDGQPLIDTTRKSFKVTLAGLEPVNDRDMARIRALGVENVVFGYNGQLHKMAPPVAADKPEEPPMMGLHNGKLAPDAPPGGETTRMWWQAFKISMPDEDLQAVVDFVCSGVYTKHQLFYKDFDATIDTQGSFCRQEILDYLVAKLGYASMKQSAATRYVDKTGSWHVVLDNEIDVGLNCLSWMTSVAYRGVTYRLRVKIYLKLVQELETAAVRLNMGQHIKDWISAWGDRLAQARDETTETGLTRCEITVYFDKGDFEFDKAHEAMPRNKAWLSRLVEDEILAVVPPHLVYHTPHRSMIAEWVSHLKHTLVIYMPETECGLVVYGYNEVTGKLSCAYDKHFMEHITYVTQLLAVAAVPIDLISVQCAAYEAPANHKDVKQAMPKELVQLLKVARSRKSPDGRAVDNLFQNFLDRDVDLEGQMSMADVCDRVLEPREGRAARRSIEADEDDDDDEDDDMAEEDGGVGENEREEGDEAPVAEEPLDAEAVAEEQDGAEDDFTAESFASKIFFKDTPTDGSLVLQTKRLHRIAVAPSQPLTTLFPKRTVGDVYFAAEPYPKRPPKGSSPEEMATYAAEFVATKQRNTMAASQVLISSGFALKGDDGALLPNGGLVAELPVTYQKPGKIVKAFHLVPCKSHLDLETNCIRPAKTYRLCYLAKATARFKALRRLKEVLRTERLALRLANIAEGVAERPEMERLMAAIRQVECFKSVLCTMKEHTVAELPIGSLNVCALRVKHFSSQGAYTPYTAFVCDGEGSNPVAYQLPKPLCVTITASTEALQPYLYRGSPGDFYLSTTDTKLGFGNVIGTITRGEGGAKAKRKHDDADGVRHPGRNIDISLTIKGVTISRTRKQTAEEKQQHADAHAAEMLAINEAAPPPALGIVKGHNWPKKLTHAYPAVVYEAGVVLRVLKASQDKVGDGKKMGWPMEVQELKADGETGVVRVVWGTPSMEKDNLHAKLTANCLLRITKIFSEDVHYTLVHADGADSPEAALEAVQAQQAAADQAEAEAKHPRSFYRLVSGTDPPGDAMPTDYKAIPTIMTGKPNDLHGFKIANVYAHLNSTRIALQAEDGRYWRYAWPNRPPKGDDAEVGAYLNVDAWRITAPAAASGSADMEVEG